MPRLHVIIASVLTVILVSLAGIIIVRSNTNVPSITFQPDERPPIAYPTAENFPDVPEGMMFVASRRGKYYYPALSTRGQELSPANRIYFKTEDEAKAAGFLHWK